MRRTIFLPALTHKKSGPAYADPLKKYRVRSILQAANRKATPPMKFESVAKRWLSDHMRTTAQ